MGPFELQLRQFAEKTGDKADAAVRTVVLEVWRRLTIRSPVDTGRFRANWSYGYGSAPTGAAKPGGTSRSPAPAAPLPKIAQGIGVHYLVNNLPYAQRLEYGWSKKAPAGMVRITAVEFVGIVDDAAALVNATLSRSGAVF
jgi:hypothetical protein